MSNVHVTISLPVDLHKKLYVVANKKNISKFVVMALEKALDEQEDLKKAYMAANQDEDRCELVKAWLVL
jgi:hypothetical protein